MPLTDSLDGAARIAGNLALAPILRRWTNAWGATPAETDAVLPGDEWIPHPRMHSTRAITIAARPETVWAWLTQIGHGRGGLYSYDALENLVGCDLHNADRLLDELPPLEPGDLVALGPEGHPSFRVVTVDAPRALVLVAADPRTRIAPDRPVTAGKTGSTWQWALRPLDEGRATRLLARQRYSYPTRMSVLWHVVEPIDFVMERKMLLGLAARAEATDR